MPLKLLRPRRRKHEEIDGEGQRVASGPSPQPLYRFGRGGGSRSSARAEETRDRGMKILIKSAWGSDDPTKAAFAFLHANAFAEAGHEVQIFLLGEAVNLMKPELIGSVTPVGWPPLSEIVPKTVAHHIPIHV
jgi:hypothetical protein